jgi:hypothetical protein
MFRAIVFVIVALLVVACGTGSLDVKPPTTPQATSEPPTQTPSPVPTLVAVATPRPTVIPPQANSPQRNGLPVTPADIVPFVRSYVRATWNYLTGAGTARGLYDLFTPDCQRMVSLTSLERTPPLVQALYRGMQGKQIDDVEFAIPLGLNATSEALQLKTPLSSQTRMRIDGTWLTVYEWLYAMNPAATNDKSETLVVRPMGDSFRIASCDNLRQWDQQR